MKKLDFSKTEWKNILIEIIETCNRYLYNNFYDEDECKIFLSIMEGLLRDNNDKILAYRSVYKEYSAYLMGKNLYGIYILSQNNSYLSQGNLYDIMISFNLIFEYFNKDKMENILKTADFFNTSLTNEMVVKIS